MSAAITFWILGLGAGAIYAALALSVLLTYRSATVVNFGYSAMALFPACVFYQLRDDGRMVLPLVWVPSSFQLTSGPAPFAVALLLALATAAVLGLFAHYAIFRWLQNAPSLAKVAASVGLLVMIEGLTILRFPTPPATQSPLPSGNTDFLGTSVPKDRLILAGLVLVVTAVLSVVYRYTRFGLATRAAAESRPDATLLGYSTQRLAAANWIIGSLLAGIFGILIAPITSLDPSAFVALIVPALAAALVGRFTSFWATAIAGLVLGSLQTEALHLAIGWSWAPKIGIGSLVSFVALVLTMVLLGKRLPTRGAVEQGRLPAAIKTTRPWLIGALATVIGVVLVLVTSGPYRLSFVTSLSAILVCLSIVVVTGFVGQISLAQLTFAGVSAFALGHLAGQYGWPFVVAVPTAIAITVVVGTLIGLVALRVRGVNLAIITAGFATAVSAFVFQNPDYTGGQNGLSIPGAKLFGWSIGSGIDLGFAMFCLVVVVLCCAGVYALRVSNLGLRMLAVRANERAAAANGVNVVRTKLLAFAVSSALAGMAGTLTAYTYNTFDVPSFDVLLSILVLAGVYITGITSVGGAVLGGIIAVNGLLLYSLNQVINFGAYQSFISGALLILVAVRNPEGIVGVASLHWRHRLDWISNRFRRANHPSTPTTAERTDIPARLDSVKEVLR